MVSTWRVLEDREAWWGRVREQVWKIERCGRGGVVGVGEGGGGGGGVVWFGEEGLIRFEG